MHAFTFYHLLYLSLRAKRSRKIYCISQQYLPTLHRSSRRTPLHSIQLAHYKTRLYCAALTLQFLFQFFFKPQSSLLPLHLTYPWAHRRSKGKMKFIVLFLCVVLAVCMANAEHLGPPVTTAPMPTDMDPEEETPMMPPPSDVDISVYITRASKIRFSLASQMPLTPFMKNDVCPDDFNNRFSIRCVPRVPVKYVKFFSARGVQREKRAPYFIRGDTGDGRVRPVFFGNRMSLNITCRAVPEDLALYGRLTPTWVVIRRVCPDADDDM